MGAAYDPSIAERVYFHWLLTHLMQNTLLHTANSNLYIIRRVQYTFLILAAVHGFLNPLKPLLQRSAV